MPILALRPVRPHAVEAADAGGLAAMAGHDREHLGRPRSRDVVVLAVEDRVAADLAGRGMRHVALTSPRRIRQGRNTVRSSLEDPCKRSRPGTRRHCTGTHRTRPRSRGRGRSRTPCTWRRRRACPSRTLRLDRRTCRPPQRRASSRCRRSLRLRKIRRQGRGCRNEPARPRVLAPWKDRTGRGCSCQPVTMGGQVVLSLGRYVSTTSYMPGSNFAIVIASCKYGRGAGSLRMAS
jgi:hypothetical protein